jgi:hypothetical protein
MGDGNTLVFYDPAGKQARLQTNVILSIRGEMAGTGKYIVTVQVSS